MKALKRLGNEVIKLKIQGKGGAFNYDRTRWASPLPPHYVPLNMYIEHLLYKSVRVGRGLEADRDRITGGGRLHVQMAHQSVTSTQFWKEGPRHYDTINLVKK